ncbi:MAG: hypothetical protein Q8S58_20465 [Bosea sp. (in: a-proteobacteria)]|uniref:hypothetical protein n=1 Tax=Bosea sp. (in: a-proteobacteria) TaxID=1871050 RepID=UPI0027359398|nr:hypothetical protein [Bosea sp. (in: a-proteobacteria)]MDP3256555.1 hypothetical protein [Bosea sp. (in: a-proteobacteria)]MDP3321504.1 hypothetical protein [Bosea sp. (in: a-proteobacteria)]
MTYVLNDTAVLPATEVQTTAKTSEGPGFWQRLYAAMIESRRRSALRELRAHSFRVNEAGLMLGGLAATSLATDEALPFNR